MSETSAVETTTHVLHIMDSTGDTRIEWDRSKPEEVELARKSWDAAKAKGYLAYRLDSSGHRGEVIREFDPEAGRIIMAQQTVGG